MIGCQLQMLVFAVIALADMVKKRSWNLGNFFLVMLFFSAVFAYTTGGRFYGHYFLQVIPYAVMIAAVSINNLVEKCEHGVLKNRALHFYAQYLLVFLLIPVAGFGIFNLKNYSSIKPSPDAVLLVDYIKVNTKSEDRIFLWSAPREALLYNNRLFATRFYHNA